MKTFNLETYKNNPDCKLAIEHYNPQNPMRWQVEEVRTENNRLVIKMPDTGYEIDEYVIIGTFPEIRDKDENLVGTLVFEPQKISIEDFKTKVYALQHGEKINFICDLDNGTEWGVLRIHSFDADLILLSIYGGESFLYDCSCQSTPEEFTFFINDVLGKDIDDFLYIHYPDNTPETFQGRINTLRKELIQAIRQVLIDNNLTEIEFAEDNEEAVFVVSFDDDCNGYDCPVRKVSLNEDSISLDVENVYGDFSTTLFRYDLGCQNLDWLSAILDKIHETLQK